MHYACTWNFNKTALIQIRTMQRFTVPNTVIDNWHRAARCLVLMTNQLELLFFFATDFIHNSRTKVVKNIDRELPSAVSHLHHFLWLRVFFSKSTNSLHSPPHP